MPVYIRKNVNFTPPSIDNFPLEDDEDYITDPDQLLDRLPQPYRMIDKVLSQWYDEVWQIIEKRENERLEESHRIRAPQYECSAQMEVCNYIYCIIEYRRMSQLGSSPRSFSLKTNALPTEMNG